MPEVVHQLFASPAVIGLIIAVVLFGAMVQAGLGMGFGQAAAPLLALVDPHLVPGPVLMLGFVTATWGAWHEREHVVWSEVGSGLMGRLAGALAAVAVLAALPDKKTFMLVFGLLIALSVIMSVAGWKMAFNRTNLVAMASISGLTGTITSIGAPPLAIVYASREAKSARATLSAFFSAGCLISLAGLFASGWSGPGDIVLALIMAPPMIAGTMLAWRLKGKFDRRYRPLLLGLAGTAAIMLIIRGLS